MHYTFKKKSNTKDKINNIIIPFNSNRNYENEQAIVFIKDRKILVKMKILVKKCYLYKYCYCI